VNGNDDLNARLVRYADDMVILCRAGNGAALHQRLKAYLGRLGLTLNEAKTRCVDSAQTAFRFLGFDIGLRRSPRTRRMYTQVVPSRKAQLRVRESIRTELNRSTLTRSSVAVVRQVNRIVRGWGNYFHYRNSSAAFAGMNRFLWQRLQSWLWQKYGRSLPRRSFFTLDRLYGQYQLHRLPTNAGWTR
jgi:hypothetical protein